MKRTCAKIIIAALLAVLLVAGCKNDDDEDDTPAVEYKVLAGRLVLYSGDGANVIVPSGTASIGNNAFKGCARLGNVFIPASVTYIAGGAFRGVEIGYIAYGDTVAHWEEVVAGSSGLAASLAGQAVVCTDGVWNAPTNPNPGGEPDVPVNPGDWQITDGVLTAYTGSGTHVTVPDGVTAIGPGAFAGSDVTAADIPASVTSIGTGAFADGTVLTFHGTAEQWEQLVGNGDLTGLTVFAVDDDGVLVGYSGNEAHVTIPDGVTAIGDGAFAGHAEITDVTIPKSVTDIGADAFKDCTGLADVVIPGSVTGIGDGAFSGCTGLTDVTIPGSVTGIGDGAFSGCTGLTDVTILSGVETIGDGAFSGCTGLTDVTIPGSVTGIGDGAFAGCDHLTDITYGGSREQLEDLCADSGIDLSEVTVTISDEASVWDIRDGVLLGYYGSETDIVIPDSVTSIGADAFSGCTGLTSVTILAGVTSIGADAFSGCTGLAGVEIPAGVTSIGTGAFKDCTGLADMTIPASVTTIGTGALAGGALETIAFAGTVAQWVGLSGGSGVGDDVIVTCSDGTLPLTVYVAGIGSDDNPGTRAKPFATIQKAVDTIIARNDGMSACTMYVDGTVTQSAAASANGMADFSALGKNLSLTIRALSGTATLDANALSRVIYAKPASGALNLTLENLVITGGNTTGNGGGICYQSAGGILTVKGCAITGNEASSGGGVYVDSSTGTFTMEGGTISGNTATAYGGGVFVYSGTFNVTDGTIGGTTSAEANTASNGGGVYVYKDTFTMEGGTISNCMASSYGGGVFINASGTFDMSGTAKIAGCKTTSTSGSGGGGIYNGGTLAITGGTVSDCTSATSGGGVYVYSGTFTMSGGEISNCTASSYGGGVYVDGSNGKLTMSGGTISGNTASNYGGGVYVRGGTFTMESGTISECTATNQGGGVYIYSSGTFTISSGEISNCTATNGGGVFITSNGTFNMSGTAKIAGCKTTSTSGRGGGVYVYGGTFTMGGGEISNCIASSYGGGVFITSSGTFNMSGTAKITGCKMTSTSGLGGGVYVSSGTFTMGGSASIPAGDDGKNDVNLASGTAITVAGALTAASPVATITLSDSAYAAGTQVLSAGVTITQDICDKFALTGDPDGTEWKVAPSADGASGVTAPRTYTFKIESGGSEVVEGSALSQGATITLREVRRDGVALTASDGTFTIELSDGYYTFASQGFSDTSATGLPATISLPPLPTSPIPLLICVKAEFANGIVIEDGIEVLITP